jgi:hypothetical protein
MSREQPVVFIIHGQIIEPLSERSGKINCGNLLQRLGFKATGENYDRNQAPMKGLFPQPIHEVTFERTHISLGKKDPTPTAIRFQRSSARAGTGDNVDRSNSLLTGVTHHFQAGHLNISSFFLATLLLFVFVLFVTFSLEFAADGHFVSDVRCELYG